MSDQFIGEIRIAAFGFAPKGWAQCNGQILAIAQNSALFSLLGTYYGGNGTVNFALPNLQGRVPVQVGTPTFGPAVVVGQQGGEATHALTATELASHGHPVRFSTGPRDAATPAGALLADGDEYGDPADSALAASVVGASGGVAAHQNMQPYLALNFIIALSGIFPSRN